jgi:hypothetical protein
MSAIHILNIPRIQLYLFMYCSPNILVLQSEHSMFDHLPYYSTRHARPDMFEHSRPNIPVTTSYRLDGRSGCRTYDFTLPTFVRHRPDSSKSALSSYNHVNFVVSGVLSDLMFDSMVGRMFGQMFDRIRRLNAVSRVLPVQFGPFLFGWPCYIPNSMSGQYQPIPWCIGYTPLYVRSAISSEQPCRPTT